MFEIYLALDDERLSSFLDGILFALYEASLCLGNLRLGLVNKASIVGFVIECCGRENKRSYKLCYYQSSLSFSASQTVIVNIFLLLEALHLLP